MPATYSINVGTAIEATRKPDIISVLKDLPDNTHKLISPRNVRDAFISTWANAPFKQTTNLAGVEYIGIDSGNPSNRDIKQKILLGKRSYANLDIMTDSLLSDQGADIYIYNTKSDSNPTQSSTKMAILAGTNSSLYYSAPYIESKIEGSKNSIEIVNPSPSKGPISIFSSTGRVAINGILFPTVAETSAASGAANGRILKYSGSYPNGYLKWADITFDETNVGSPGLPTNIYGSPVKLNGYSLEFVDSSVVPVPIGGVPAGFSFSSKSFYNPTGATYQNWPLTEVLRKVIYPYVQPSLSLSVLNNDPTSVAYGTTYAESGQSINVALKYDLTIYPKTEDEYVSNYLILNHEKNAAIGPTFATSYSGLSFSGIPGKTFSSTIIFSISSSAGDSGGQYVYTMAYSNVPGAAVSGYPGYQGAGMALSSPYINSGWSYSASATINFIRPIFYGFSGTTNSVSFNPLLPYSTDAGNLNTFMTAAPTSQVAGYFNGFNYLTGLQNASSGLLKKHIGPAPENSSMLLSVNGTGRLYFIYPRNNGAGRILDESSLISIKDPNGFVLYQKGSPTASSFYPGTFDMQNQVGASPYVLWISKSSCSYTGDGSFELVFGTASTFSWPYSGGVSSGPIIDNGN